MPDLFDDAAQDHLREQAAERLRKYREIQDERFLGDGWPAPEEQQARAERSTELVDLCRSILQASIRPGITRGECPECGEPNTRFHRCQARD